MESGEIIDAGPWVVWEGEIRRTEQREFLEETTGGQKAKVWKSILRSYMGRLTIDRNGRLGYFEGFTDEGSIPGEPRWHWYRAEEIGELKCDLIVDYAVRALWEKLRASSESEKVKEMQADIERMGREFDKGMDAATQTADRLQARSKELLREAEHLRDQLKAKTEEADSWKRRFEETQREPATEDDAEDDDPPPQLQYPGYVARMQEHWTDANVADELALGNARGRILMALATGPLKSTPLATRAQCSNATVTNYCKDFEAAGWLEYLRETHEWRLIKLLPPARRLDEPEEERKDGRAVEGAGPENRSAVNGAVGSNPTPSATESAGAPVSVSPGVPNGHENGRVTPPSPSELRNAAPGPHGSANAPAGKLNLAAEIKADTPLSKILRLLAGKPFMLKEMLMALKLPQTQIYSEIERARNAGIDIKLKPTGYYVLESRVEGLMSVDVR